MTTSDQVIAVRVGLYLVFVAAPRRRQRRRRLRQGARGRRGSPQHDRRAWRVAPFHPSPAGACARPVSAEHSRRRSLSCVSGCRWRRARPRPGGLARRAALPALARVWARLAFMASEVVFFQGELAHADYTAAPEPSGPILRQSKQSRTCGDSSTGATGSTGTTGPWNRLTLVSFFSFRICLQNWER